MDPRVNHEDADTPKSVLDKESRLIEYPPGVSESGLITEPFQSKQRQAAWYAVYTKSRFEKKMLSELTDRSIEVFLPMREILSRWKDRKKRIWVPLFPGYIFVNHIDTPENRYRVLNVPGAVRFVGHEGHAEQIPDEQIVSVRRFLEASISIDPYPYLKIGRRVEIIAGPLKGIIGILVQKKGRFRFVLQVDLIRQAVSVEIDASDVRPL
ncbi:MAG TPA: UpxY family transcription antiterminator [Acidobacteriota bacterium]|nr:UpxY family transcription antiterminator [Acidobacteriota bacterium]